MNLQLKRPIVFFDLETTGLDVAKDHIVELSYVKVKPAGDEERGTIRFRPVDVLGNTLHIPDKTTEFHGITDEDVAQCPTFKECAQHIWNEVFQGADLAGFNSNRFDIPLLVEELLRSGVNVDLTDVKFLDVQNIYHKMEKRNLAAAYKFYCGKDLTDAHHAQADTEATYEVLRSQLDHYTEELKNDVDFLADFSSMGKNVDLAGRIVYDEQGDEIFTFGKHKGNKVKDVVKDDPGFISWILKGDFALNTKQEVQRLSFKYK